jgi:hypothetical protein
MICGLSMLLNLAELITSPLVIFATLCLNLLPTMLIVRILSTLSPNMRQSLRIACHSLTVVLMVVLLVMTSVLSSKQTKLFI